MPSSPPRLSVAAGGKSPKRSKSQRGKSRGVRGTGSGSKSFKSGGKKDFTPETDLSETPPVGATGQKTQISRGATQEDLDLEREDEEADEERRKQWEEEDEEEEAVRAAMRRPHESLETAPELSKEDILRQLTAQYEQALKQVGVALSHFFVVKWLWARNAPMVSGGLS